MVWIQNTGQLENNRWSIPINLYKLCIMYPQNCLMMNKMNNKLREKSTSGMMWWFLCTWCEFFFFFLNFIQFHSIQLLNSTPPFPSATRGDEPFDPSTFVSEFNHVFITVKKHKHGYHVNVVSRVCWGEGGYLFISLFIFFLHPPSNQKKREESKTSPPSSQTPPSLPPQQN